MSLLDLLTGTTATAAYSLGRRLRTAYAGSAFTVRRSSDNTTLTIGYQSGVDTVDYPTLLTFCAGTNGYLTTLYDNTTNGYHLAQATTTLQPQIVSGGALLNSMNGLPAATGGQMQNTAITMPSSNTVMTALVATVDTGGTTNARVFSFLATGQANDYSNTPSFLLYTPNTTGGLVALRNSVSATDTAALNIPLIVGATWNGSVATLTVNSVVGTSVASTGNFGTTGSLNFHNDGWNGGGTGETWTGYTSELILAPAMSSADYATAQINMAAQYRPTAGPLQVAGVSTEFLFTTVSPLNLGGVSVEFLASQAAPLLQLGAVSVEFLASQSRPMLTLGGIAVEFLILSSPSPVSQNDMFMGG